MNTAADFVGSPRGQRSVRIRLLAAAQELFMQNGYRATTTREISSRAGVAEPTLFRNFGSKAELFEATLVASFSQFFDGWIDTFSAQEDDARVESLVFAWVESLFDLLQKNRDHLRLVIAAGFESEPSLQSTAERISDEFANGIRRIAEQSRLHAAYEKFRVDDPTSTLAVEVSMIMGTVLLSEWVFPHDVASPSRDTLIREIATMMLHGAADRTYGAAQ